MVFESIVADVLNRFLGDYVENLDQSQLKIGIWGGDVVLENLTLKQSALDELSLPVKTTFGHLGKLVLKIPWKNLYSAPVVASLERLFLLVVPNNEVKYDASKEEKWCQEAKQQQLRKVQEAKKRELEKDKPKADDSFVEKLATQIIKNVQVKIHDIHIRYEDKVTNISRPFALGITLHHLSVHTTDKHWKEAVIQDAATEIYKILILEGLALYWNSNTTLFKGNSTEGKLILHEFKETVCRNDFHPQGFRYILGPINSTVKLTLNPKPELNNYKSPKAQLVVDLEKLLLGLSKSQYHDVIGLIESIGRMTRAAPYRKFRPNLTGYRGHYREWWHFAYKCILEQDVRRVRNNWNWNFMLKHVTTCRRYATAYQTKLTSKKLSPEQTAELESLENTLDVLNMVLIRQRVEMDVERQGRKVSEQKKEGGWFSSWWGGSAAKSEESAPTSDLAKKFESAMTPEEKHKLFRAIDYQENDSPDDYSEDFVDMIATFNLAALEIELSDEAYTEPLVLNSKLSHVSSRIERRPAAKALSVIATIQQFTVCGLAQGNNTPMLVVSKDVVPTEGNNLLYVLYETNPMDKSCDQRIHVSSRPLQITYDASTINKVADIFRAQLDPSALNQLQAVAESQLQNFREMSATGLQYAIEHHTVLDLNVNLMSSLIIIPKGGIYLGVEDVVVINLGCFSMVSVARDPMATNIRALYSQGTSEEDIMKSMISQSYDKFSLNLSDMQVLIALAGEDWKTTLQTKAVSPLHLLQPMSLIVNLEKCLIQDDPRLPKIKVYANLPSVSLSLTDERLLRMIVLGLSMPKPGDGNDGNLGAVQSDKGSRGSSHSIASKLMDIPLELGIKAKENKGRKKAPKTDELVQAIEFDLKFEMNDFSVDVYQSTSVECSPEDKLLSFRVMSLECDFMQLTYDMEVTARLGGVVLDVFDPRGQVRMLNTPMADGERQYLFVVTYINVDRKSPDFQQKHDCTLKLMKVQFTKLSVLLHQESLLSLMAFSQSFQKKLEDAQKEIQEDRVGTTGKETTGPLTPIAEVPSPSDFLAPPPPTVLNTGKRRLKKEWLQTIEFKLEADLDNFHIRVATYSNLVTDIMIKGCAAMVVIKKFSTEIAAHLKNITVTDLNPKTHHKKIMCVLADEALSAHVVKYEPDHNLYFEKDVPDVLIQASVARIQIVYLGWFVTNVLKFADTFQAAQAKLIEAAAEAATAAKQNMQQAVSKASKISFGINLQAPICIIPMNSTSRDAMVMDFGYLHLLNKFRTLETPQPGHPGVIFDDMELHLKNVKLTRVKVDDNYKVLHETVILRPVTFTLMVARNLSGSWYTDGPDISVSGKLQEMGITLTKEDYKVLMRILSENLNEAQLMEEKERRPSCDNWVESKSSLQVYTQNRPSTLDGLNTHTTAEVALPPKVSPAASANPNRENLRFQFFIEKFVIEIFNGGVKAFDDASEEQDKHGLACFLLDCISLKGHMFASQEIRVKFRLHDCLLDDKREGKAKITRLMSRKRDPKITPDMDVTAEDLESEDESKVRSMIAVNCKQLPGEINVEMSIYGFDLILNVDLLMKVAEFFTSHIQKEVEPEVPEPVELLLVKSPSMYSSKRKHSIVSKHSALSTKPGKPPVKPASPTKTESPAFCIIVRLQKPDIILVESMDDINTSALILNTEVVAKVRMHGTQQNVECAMTNLQLYSCCFNPETRKDTMALILHPCSMHVIGSTPDGGGLHFDCHLTDTRLAVSPSTIELLNKVYTVVYGSVVPPPKDLEREIDYSEIWQTLQYDDTQFWFLHTEVGQDAMLAIPSTPEPKPVLSEICVLRAPSIIITLEAGIGRQTLPMILLETSLNVQARDWSSQLFVESVMSVQMAYYNSCLALWEPLIEPVETLVDGKVTHCPWELKAVVQKRSFDALSVSMSPSAEQEMEELVAQTPALSIDISSKDNLELTVSKTSLEVFTMLGKAFQTAVTSGISETAGITAPYTVFNDTGFSVTVVLNEGPFKVYEGEDYRQVVLKSGAQVGLCLRYNGEESSCKAILGRVSSSASIEAQSLIKEKFLQVVVRVNTAICELELPLVRADKRYFSLRYRGEGNDPWGLVSVVQVVDGGTLLTLRSILQIHNHFCEPVDVYYMTKRGNELECIGTVDPESEINLPLYSIYTPTNELFFSVKGYTVSVTPFVWKDLKNMLTTTKLLQCNPKNPEEKEPFIMQVVGDTEQIYFEKTNRHPMDSTMYNIHLRPAVVLKNLLPLDLIVCLQGLPLERVVKGGERLQLPTAEPGTSKIILKIPNYLDKLWSCEREVVWNTVPFNVWTFNSLDSSQKMTLDLGLHTEHKNGTLIMSLYCPFWMLNKTGLMISYRKSRKSERSDTTGSPLKQSEETTNVLYHPDNFQGPVLFSFRAKSFFGKKKAAIKIEDGEWSDKFSLDVAGSSGVVNCKYNGTVYQIGVHIQLTYSTLTKQVTFTPYHVLMNNSRVTIECQEADRAADPWTKVAPGACTPMWPRSLDVMKEMRLRVQGTTQISAPFSYSIVHTTLLKLDNKYGGVNVDVQITEGAAYISFAQYEPGVAPALLLNHTNIPIQIWEKDMESYVRTLNPQEMSLFTWQKPTGARVVVWNAGKKKELSDALRKDGIGEFQPEPNKKVYWVSFLDGIQRIFLFTLDMNIARDAQTAGELEPIDREVNLSIHGVGMSLVNNYTRTEVVYVGIASSGIIWETKKVSGKRYKPLCIKDCELIEEAFNRYQAELSVSNIPPKPRRILGPNLEVDFENGELIQPSLKHLRRTYHTGMWLQMKTSTHQMQLHAKINRVQIDNQMYDNVFPVVLAPVPPPKSVAASQALKPFAELSIVRRIMEHSPVQQYKYFKVLIQEFHVKVDIGFINALLALFEAGEVSEQDDRAHFEEDRQLVDKPLLSHVSLLSSQEQKNFYDLLHFSPLKIHLSFSLSAGGGTQKGGTMPETPHFLNILLQSLGVTLTDVQDVVFKLAFFERESTFLTQRQLINEARMHYVGQSLKQLYVLVLGLDVIGNPYGLVLGLTQGVEDLFYEPFQGAIQGPGEFAEGLVLGVRSLFGHTVGGAAGAVSRITGAMGKGIAALTFDKDYQRKRREVMNQRPASAQAGLAQSSKGLVMGVVDGVSGVFMKPISGAREEGVEGFFKGVGKGVVGLVTRPTAGVIDFASGSLDAVKRVAEMSHEVTRLRPPRFFHQDGLVRPYVRSEAEGNKLLQELDKGRYVTTDVYEFHLPHVNGTKDVLLLTDKRIMYIEHTDMFGYSLAWHYTWDSMKIPPRVDEKGIFISTSEMKKKVLGLFSSGETGKLIIIKNPEQRNLVAKKIEMLMKN